jgi:hypothetical protein
MVSDPSFLNTLSPDVRERLEASRRPQAVQARMGDFLLALANGDPELVIGVGYEGWGVIEGTKRGRKVLRLFPSKGLLKVSNLISDSGPGDYGEHVVLGPKGEWSFTFTASEVGEDDLARCASDALAQMAGRRIRPGPKAPSHGEVRTAQDREWRRSRLPSSTRYAILVRDAFTCQYCGRSAPQVVLHIDHRTPVALGGGDEIENLVTACIDCNLGKGARHST